MGRYSVMALNWKLIGAWWWRVERQTGRCAAGWKRPVSIDKNNIVYAN